MTKKLTNKQARTALRRELTAFATTISKAVVGSAGKVTSKGDVSSIDVDGMTIRIGVEPAIGLMHGSDDTTLSVCVVHRVCARDALTRLRKLLRDRQIKMLLSLAAAAQPAPPAARKVPR